MSTPTPSPTPAEQFLANELAATRQSLQRTRLAGIVVIVIVAGYMSVVTKSLNAHLEPHAAAEYATMVVADTSDNLLLQANATAVAKGTSVQLIGPANTVAADKALALANLPSFTLAPGAVLTVADSVYRNGSAVGSSTPGPVS